MDIALLKTFDQVAKHGSITAAAQSLGYTQSAVSRQVSALETWAGATLFDRYARGVRLTDQGRCLLVHIEAVLDRLGGAREELQALGRLEGGRVRIGAFPTAVAALLPGAMAAFGAKHPKVSLSLVEGTTRRQLSALHDGDVDLAVLSAFPDQQLDGERFDLVHLLDDVMLVALPRSHLLAARRSLRLAELVEERWIAADASEDDRLLGPASLRAGHDFRVEFVVREWTAKLGLVAAGLGITLVPSLAADAVRADIALVSLDPDDGPARGVYAATSAARLRPLSVGTLIDALKEAAERVPVIGRTADARL
jgi:DNA-binding transcriptional LysR family regulator